MDMYNVYDNGNAESCMIQGAESYQNLTTPFLEQFDAMYNEGAPELIDQGLYYPTATNYGYYCTGFESPGEWEDHHKIFGVDGPEFQYTGAQTESLPYVYYTPNYGYAQSPYNPYNPYIPGAIMGVDGSLLGAQQYYTIPPYQESVSSPSYVPVVIQQDISPNSLHDPLLNSSASVTHRPDAKSVKHNFASASTVFPSNPSKSASNQRSSFTRVSEGSRARVNVGPNKQALVNGSVSSASSHVRQGRAASGALESVGGFSSANIVSNNNQFKVPPSNINGFSDFGSNGRGRSASDKVRPKIPAGRDLSDVSGSADAFAVGEQNRGPRINRSKGLLTVKAYTTKVGNTDAHGNIIINTDQYNREDFPVVYENAKFFVIKSYSEDDVHKSVKYGVWSSTSHGNKKLQSAYEAAHKAAAGRPGGCPIFLFFSVNASSQFCGVAEMIGPVDFHKDMDFWQQDKWSGSFPVKWHIIKDVPNTCFRHIILENNENKPVTNSRDTQEVMCKEGLEMLKIFKSHPLNTSLFDDFMYYERRHKFLQEDKSKFLYKSFHAPFFVPPMGLADELNCVVQPLPKEVGKTTEHMKFGLAKASTPVTLKTSSSPINPNSSTVTGGNAEQVKAKNDIASSLSIGSLAITPKHDESKPSGATPATATNSERANVFTVGSMPVKVNGVASESSGMLTVGSIPLNPKALDDKAATLAKNSS